MLFLSKSKDSINNVYTSKIIKDNPVRDWNDVLKNPDEVKNEEYIFSTWGMPSLSEDEIKQYLPNLKAVFYGAGSVQFFARPFLSLGVKIFSAWAFNAKPVVEVALSQILLANKGYFQLPSRYAESIADNDKNSENKETRSQFRKYYESFPGNYNVKVGIIGAGMIGKRLIKMLSQFDIEILVFDPFLPDEAAAELGVEKTSLEKIFTECQTISNHLANNSETVNILNYDLFKLMKDNATFINTGRGMQVKIDDLVRILKEKPGCTALLDVTDPTEPLPAGSLLFELPNLFITPHRAGVISNEVQILGVCMMEEYENYIAGKPTKYEVTIKMLETMA